MSKRRRWILLPLAALAAILIVVLALFDWNWLRRPLEGAVSTALEREFQVADLDVELATAPTITLQQVRIANAPWGSRPDMLTISQVRFAIELWPLLKGEIRLPFLQVQQPDLLLETNQQGLANWKFGEQDQPEAPPVIPIIRDLEVAKAAIRYHEPGRAQDLIAGLQTVAGTITSSGVQLSADGNLNEQPLSLRFASAPVGQLETETEAKRFPFELEAGLGQTRLAATGSAEQPLQAQGVSVEIVVESEEPGTLLALAGREPRDLAPLRLSLALTRHDQLWALRDIDGRLGESDLSGDASFSNQGEEPAITADLHSKLIRLADVQDVIEVVSGNGRAPRQPTVEAALADAQAALEAKPKEHGPAADAAPGVSPGMLPKVDAEVSYTIARLSGPELALTGLELYARLEDGQPQIELTGGGQYRGAPGAVDVRLGRTGQAARGDGAYPVQARIEAARTEIQVDGVIRQPQTLDGLDLQVQVASENVNELLPLTGLDLPQIPPLLISGHVIQDGQVWRIAELYAQFNESEVAGELTADLSKRRPFITADLRSQRLLLSDLITVGEKPAVIEVDEAASSAEESETEEPALISLEGVNFEVLPEVDADVSFQGEFVEFEEFRFERLSFDLKLRERIAVLDGSGEGQFRDGPLIFKAHAGSEENLENPDARYPLELRIDSRETEVTVEGTAAEPGRLEGLQVDVALRGPDLDRLGEMLQLSLPTTPPFELRSHLTHDANRWTLTGLDGTIGDSDVQGDATVVVGGERPTLEAELTSNKLDFDDLGLLVGAPADPDETASVEQERAAAEEAARKGVLPDEPFDVPELRSMNARVSYRAKQVQAQKLPLESMMLDLTLENGRLTFEPLRFDLADGELVSTIRLDGRTDVLDGDFEADVRNIRLNRLLAYFDIEIAEIEMEQEGVGTFTGHAQLAVRGNSINQLAASADGQVVFIMRGGQINAVLIEGIGLDVGEVLAVLLRGDEEAQSEMVPIRCFVGRFDVQDGIMRAEALVLETSDATVTGKGQIDLGNETLSLEFLAHPKDTSILTASTPVRIEGTFEEPKIDPISEELQEKSLAALALGIVMPVIGAIIPFFEEGETEDTSCARLIQAASAAGQSESPSPR
jgi:uncharacterized protein involved in outer membrane biogenesis